MQGAYGGGYGGYWGWGWWFWVFWAVILFLIIWGIGWGGWYGRRRRGAPPPNDEIIGEVPREEQILRERYARGEITKEEFDRKLNDLRRAA